MFPGGMENSLFYFSAQKAFYKLEDDLVSLCNFFPQTKQFGLCHQEKCKSLEGQNISMRNGSYCRNILESFKNNPTQD